MRVKFSLLSIEWSKRDVALFGLWLKIVLCQIGIYVRLTLCMERNKVCFCCYINLLQPPISPILTTIISIFKRYRLKAVGSACLWGDRTGDRLVHHVTFCLHSWIALHTGSYSNIIRCLKGLCHEMNIFWRLIIINVGSFCTCANSF